MEVKSPSVKWPSVLLLASVADLKKCGENFEKSEVLDVKAVTKRGASWQVGLPKEIAQALGLESGRNKLVFLRAEISGNAVYIITSGRALIPL